MIDTEITLRGHAAEEFFRQMISVDMSSIRSRDMFIADAGSSIDESGVLSIDASDLDIDLSVLDEPKEKVVEVRHPKKERYSINIVIKYTSSSLNDINYRLKKSNSYEINNYYKSDEPYSTNRNKSFEYAA